MSSLVFLSCAAICLESVLGLRSGAAVDLNYSSGRRNGQATELDDMVQLANFLDNIKQPSDLRGSLSHSEFEPFVRLRSNDHPLADAKFEPQLGVALHRGLFKCPEYGSCEDAMGLVEALRTSLRLSENFETSSGRNGQFRITSDNRFLIKQDHVKYDCLTYLRRFLASNTLDPRISAVNVPLLILTSNAQAGCIAERLTTVMLFLDCTYNHERVLDIPKRYAYKYDLKGLIHGRNGRMQSGAAESKDVAFLQDFPGGLPVVNEDYFKLVSELKTAALWLGGACLRDFSLLLFLRGKNSSSPDTTPDQPISPKHGRYCSSQSIGSFRFPMEVRTGLEDVPKLVVGGIIDVLDNYKYGHKKPQGSTFKKVVKTLKTAAQVALRSTKVWDKYFNLLPGPLYACRLFMFVTTVALRPMHSDHQGRLQKLGLQQGKYPSSDVGHANEVATRCHEWLGEDGVRCNHGTRLRDVLEEVERVLKT